MKRISETLHERCALRRQHGKRRNSLAVFLLTFLFLVVSFGVNALAQVNVYTRSYDNARTGDNTQETVLTQANVNSNTFGKLFTVHTDGQIFAQPLYVSNLTIGGAAHNVVFVASMRDTVYAIDAESGTVLWSQNYGTPQIPQQLDTDQNISYSTGIGILGTPVIDPATNYMYFVTGLQPTGTYNYSYALNAIDITTGDPVHGSPVTITGTYQTADLAAPLKFNPAIQNARPGLALANGNVYIAFSSHEDQHAYHGWIFSYSASTLAQAAVYVDTTIGTLGGIWQAGQAPAVDSTGNIYYSTGNGSFGTTANNLPQTGNSFVKLSPTLQLEDYFTPYASAAMNNIDWDLGSAGVMLMPNTNYVVGGGKPGILYVTSNTDMGKFNASADQVHQEFQAVYGNGTSHIHGGPVYFNSDVNGPSVYVWGENDKLRGFEYNATTTMLTTTPFATSTMTAPVTNDNGAMPGGFLSVSANGDDNGIVWASTPYNANALTANVEGVLYAFNAETLQVLWTDKTNAARDDVGLFAKYVPPIVANGKMYVPNFGAPGTTDGSGNLVCYGLLLPPLTVNVANATMTAGSALPTFTGTVTGLENGDTVGGTIIVTYSTTATTASPAGTYPITATVTGSSAANYTLTVDAGTLTVTAAPLPTLTVAASNATRAYNTANPAFTGTVTGAQNGDTFTETFATTATQTSPVGTYSIVPTAAGTNLANYTVQTNNGTLTVTQAAQTITFGAIAAKVYGSAPFAVTATSSAGANYGVTIAVQSGPASIAAGTVTLTGVGTVVLKATQAGDANYAAAAAVTQSFAVTQAQLTAAASNASRAYNTANPTFAGTVTGAVGSDTFTETFTTTAVTTSNVGAYPIVPAVTGTNLANYAVTAVNGTLTVTAAPTTTTLAAPATATGGNSVALTATVASTAGSPSGTVTFYSGTTALGTGTLSGNGMATITTTTLAVGTDSVTAGYPATGNFAASTSAASSINVAAPSQTITFPSITNRPYGTPPFAVSATSSLGTSYPVTVTVQAGPASITGGMVTVNAIGTVVLLATQAGDASHSAATATQSFQVVPAALTVAAANASRAFGAANPTFTGTVTGAVGSDAFTETFTTAATSSSNVGAYPIVPAVTGPTANYTVTLTNGTLTVNGAATTTTVTAPSTANSGASVTLTATVASGAGTPGGSVTFTSGSTALGTGTLSAGTASVNTTALPSGANTVTATYAAAGNFAGSSGTASVNVSSPLTNPGSYAIAASPSTLSAKAGSPASTMLTLTPSGGYSGTVSLTCSGLPSNATCSFAQSQVKFTGNNQASTVALTINTTAIAAIRTPASPGLLALAFYWPGGLTGLAVFVRKRKSKMPRVAQFFLLMLCMFAFAAGLSGCGSSSSFGTEVAQVTVTATAGTATQTTVLNLTVTP